MMVVSQGTPSTFDRLLVVASDIEMGAGGPTDDCPHSADLADRLLEYDAAHPDVPIEFVFNGDTFDFLKTSVEGDYPRYVTERLAVEKLERIVAAHSRFFERLRALLQRPGRSAVFVVGNHDFELFYPAVQRRLNALLGDRVHFPGLSYEHADVRIEHGSQGDPLFRIDPERIFIEHEGDQILNLPWGAVGVVDTLLPYHGILHALDRIRPKSVLFEMLPEARTLLTALAKRYWLGEYWHDLWVEQDPLKQVSLHRLKEVFFRFLANDAEVKSTPYFLQMLERKSTYRVLIVGHEHVAQQIREADRVLLTTGCLRQEWAIDPESGELRNCSGSLAEVRLCKGKTVDARLVEVPLPAPRVDPPDLSSIRPVVLRCLEALEPGPDILPALALALSRQLRKRWGLT